MDYYSNTLVVSIFMLGLGLGGYLGAWVTQRIKHYILFFFSAEILISCFGFVSDFFIRSVSSISIGLSSGASASESLTFDFILNLLLLIWPTVLMGSSLPIITHFYRNTLKPGSTTGLFYSINILGATLGAFISGTVLLGNLGISTTLEIVSVVNGLFSIVFFVVFWNSRVTSPENVGLPDAKKEPVEKIGGESFLSVWKIYLVSFGTGFIAIGTEMIFFRLNASYLSNVSYVFSLILAVYLIMMAIGTGLAGWAIKEGFSNRRIFKICLLGYIFSWLLTFLMPMVLKVLGKIPEDFILGSSSHWRSLIQSFFLVVPNMIPVIFISGIFPLLVHLITRNPGELGKNVGSVYLVQTYGNFFGAVLTSFVLFPVFGVVNVIKIFSILLVVLFWLVFFKEKDDTREHGKKNSFIFGWGAVALGCALQLLILSNNFFLNFTFYRVEPIRLKEVREGIVLSYDYLEKSPSDGANVLHSRINLSGGGVTGYFHEDRDYPIWPNDVYLALLKSPPEKVLIIGTGSGLEAIILKALFPDVEITIVELLETVFDELGQLGSPMTQEALNNSTKIVGDGKRYVDRLEVSSENQFDLIQVGVFHVTAPGAGGLFTKETLQKMKQLLTPNGILNFNAYVPAVKSGLDIFNSVYVLSPGDRQIAHAIMMNTPPLSEKELSEQYSKALGDIRRRLKSAGLDHVFDASIPSGNFLIMDKNHLRKVTEDFPEQTNDFPVTEYFFSQKTVFGGPYYDPRLWPSKFGNIQLGK